MHTFENNVEFENSETNLNQPLKNIGYPKLNLSLALNPDRQQMKPDHRVMDLDWNLWACLKHHSSNDTVFELLNRCILCRKKCINIVLHTLLHNKWRICRCARFSGIRLLSFERGLTENLDYKITCEAASS